MVQDPHRWRLPLGRWVSRYGVTRLAPQLSVTPHAIYDWVAGRRVPRPPCAAAMVKLSRGAITFDDIYRHRTQMERLSSGGPRGARQESLDGGSGAAVQMRPR